MTEVLKSWMVWIDANPLAGYYIAVFTIIWPVSTIFARAGFKRAEAFVLLAPFIGYFAMLGLLVFRRWPVLPAKAKKEVKA